MTVQKFNEKPKQPQARSGIYAAQYHTGGPLDDLLAVAKKAGAQAVLAECPFPSLTVLVVRWDRSFEDGPGKWDYEIVHDGDWLCYSEEHDLIFDDTTRGIEQWYDPEPASQIDRDIDPALGW